MTTLPDDNAQITGFEWDLANREKCQRHGVSIAAIESLFAGSISVFPDPAHSKTESRFIAIGKTSERRHVLSSSPSGAVATAF